MKKILSKTTATKLYPVKKLEKHIRQQYLKKTSLRLHLHYFYFALKVLNFVGVKFREFRNFWLFLRSFVPVKLNTCQVCDFLFPNILILIPVHRTSLPSVTKFSVSVTYLITITLINNRKAEWDVRFLFFLKLRNQIHEMYFFPIAKLSNSEIDTSKVQCKVYLMSIKTEQFTKLYKIR